MQKKSFRKNMKTNMKTYDKIRNQKLKYDINREAAKISALLSGKIHKYEYFTGKTILPSDQSAVTEQEKSYSLLEKALEKQLNKIKEQWNINKNEID